MGEYLCTVGCGGEGCSPGSPPRPTSLLLPAGYSISSFLQMLHPECKELPEPNLLPGQLSHGAVGVKEGRVQWISMAFESVSPRRSREAQCRVFASCVSLPVPGPHSRWGGGVALQRGRRSPERRLFVHSHLVSKH